MTRRSGAVWTGWSCVSGPAHFVDWLVWRGRSVTWDTFRSHVNISTIDYLEPWQIRMLHSDYSVLFLKVILPSGILAWVMRHGGIEYLFCDGYVDIDAEAELAAALEAAADALDLDIYKLPQAAVDGLRDALESAHG